MNPKHKKGDKKQIGATTVEVMRDADAGQSFGGIWHYAVMWSDSEHGNHGCGWMPVFLFDQLA